MPGPPEEQGDEEQDVEENLDEDDPPGSFSACVSIVEGEPPAAPSECRAVARGPTRIDVGWRDNSNNEDGFELERSFDAIDWRLLVVRPPNQPFHFDTGLRPGTTHHYRVRAFNANGKSEYSNTAGATTDEQVPVEPPDEPPDDPGGDEPPFDPPDEPVGLPWDPEDPFGDRPPPPPPPDHPYKPLPPGSGAFTPLFPDLRVEYVEADDGVLCMERFFSTSRNFEIVFNCDMDVDEEGNPVVRSYRGINIPAHRGHIFADEQQGPDALNPFASWGTIEAFFHPAPGQYPFLPLESYNSSQPKEPRGSHQPTVGRNYFVYPPFRRLLYYKKGSSQVSKEQAEEAWQVIYDWVKVEALNRPWAHISEPGVPPTVHSDFFLNNGTFRRWGKTTKTEDGWGAWEESGEEHQPSANLFALGHRLGAVVLWMHWRWVIQAYLGSPNRTGWRNTFAGMHFALRLINNAYWAGFDFSDPNLIAQHCGGITPRAAMKTALAEINFPRDKQGIRRELEAQTAWPDQDGFDFNNASACGECRTTDWTDSQGRRWGHQMQLRKNGEGPGLTAFAIGQTFWHAKYSLEPGVRDDPLLDQGGKDDLDELTEYLTDHLKRLGWEWDQPNRGQFGYRVGRGGDPEGRCIFPDEDTCWEAIDHTDATCDPAQGKTGCSYNAGRGSMRAHRIPSGIDGGTGVDGYNPFHTGGTAPWRYIYSSMAVLVRHPTEKKIDHTCREGKGARQKDYWIKWGLRGGTATNNWKRYGDQFIAPIYAMLEFYEQPYDIDSGGGGGPPPDPPSQLEALPWTTASIRLRWKNNAASGTARGIEIQRKLGSEPSTEFRQVKILQNPTRTTYLDRGLLIDTAYSYRIRTFGDTGTSAFSNVAEGNTKANPDDPGGEDPPPWDSGTVEAPPPDNPYKPLPTGSGAFCPLYPDLRVEYASTDAGVEGVLLRFFSTSRRFEIVYNCEPKTLEDGSPNLHHYKGRLLPWFRGHIFEDDTTLDSLSFSTPALEWEAFQYPDDTFPFTTLERGGLDNNKNHTGGTGPKRRYLSYAPFRNLYWWLRGSPAIARSGTNTSAQLAFDKLYEWNRIEVVKRPWAHISAPFTRPTVRPSDGTLNPNTFRQWGYEQEAPDENGVTWNAWNRGHNETGPQSAACAIGMRLGAVTLWLNWLWVSRFVKAGSGSNWMDQPRSIMHYLRLNNRAYWAGFDYADPEVLADFGENRRPKADLGAALEEAAQDPPRRGVRYLQEVWSSPEPKATIALQAVDYCDRSDPDCAVSDFVDSQGRHWGEQFQTRYQWQNSWLAFEIGELFHSNEFSVKYREGELLLDSFAENRRLAIEQWYDRLIKKYYFWWDGPATQDPRARADRGTFPYGAGRIGDFAVGGHAENGLFPDDLAAREIIAYSRTKCDPDADPPTKGCTDYNDSGPDWTVRRVPKNHLDPSAPVDPEAYQLYGGGTSSGRWFTAYVGSLWCIGIRDSGGVRRHWDEGGRPPFVCTENGVHYLQKWGFIDRTNSNWLSMVDFIEPYYALLQRFGVPFTNP